MLFIVEFYAPHVGGVELLFELLARDLVKAGHSVTVLTSRVNGTPYREVRDGVHVQRVWVPKMGSRYAFTVLALIQAWRLAGQADIIHTTTFNAALPAALVGRLRRKPVIVTVHEVWGDLWKRIPGIPPLTAGVFQAFEWFIMQLPYTKYVCVSQATEKSLNHYYPRSQGKSVVVYNGLDLDPVKSVTSKKDGIMQVLYYGRPGISKGVENLIAAANTMNNPRVEIRMIVSSDEPKRYDFLKRQITSSQVHMEPSLPRKGLMEAIAAADYVVIPSLCEGFGFAALEACLLGKKVLCSNQGALPEVVSGQIAFFNPWKTEELTALLNQLPEVRFTTTPLRIFPLSDTCNNYLALYQ